MQLFHPILCNLRLRNGQLQSVKLTTAGFIDRLYGLGNHLQAASEAVLGYCTLHHQQSVFSENIAVGVKFFCPHRQLDTAAFIIQR